MTINQINHVLLFTIGISLSSFSMASEKTQQLTDYCVSKKGTVTPMTAWFETPQGFVKGLTKQFCTFERDNGYLVIGLSAFASDHPNIAATYMKSLPEIKEGSPIWGDQKTKTKGLGAANPSYAVCQNLGGTAINFKFRGNFKPADGGEADVCTFGDGSMVSGWTLIYMANHRDGYDEVKNNVKSEPLPLPLFKQIER